MPEDETITSYADGLIELAERVIVAGGGRRRIVPGRPVYEIVTEAPQNVLRWLADLGMGSVLENGDSGIR